jgi:hypothetical protein
MVMMVVAMMVMGSRENGAGEHQQKQGGCEDLFHATNVAWTPESRKSIKVPVSRDAMGAVRVWEAVSSRNWHIGTDDDPPPQWSNKPFARRLKLR